MIKALELDTFQVKQLSPTDYLWLYITVPAIIVSVLVLIRFIQRKMSKPASETFRDKQNKKEVYFVKNQGESDREHLKRIREAQPQETGTVNNAEKPPNCPHYLGYLYMSKTIDRANIQNECYNCRKLLQCMYSPNVIEKVYGE